MSTLDWFEQHAVSIDTAIHLNEHARFHGDIRYDDHGRPYLAFKIVGPHTHITVFIHNEAVAHDLLACIQTSVGQLTDAHSGTTKAGEAA